jgi:uncharacterized protein
MGERASEPDSVDLAALRLSAGEGRRLQCQAGIEPLLLSGERYAAEPSRISVALEVSRMMGGGYALRLSFTAAVVGPCMRCLKPAAPIVEVEAREVDRPIARGLDGADELDSPYVQEETLQLSAWVRDAFALAMPVKVLCREDCRGLCPVCAADLNEAPPEHRHESEPDPRWAKLSELELE